MACRMRWAGGWVRAGWGAGDWGAHCLRGVGQELQRARLQHGFHRPLLRRRQPPQPSVHPLGREVAQPRARRAQLRQELEGREQLQQVDIPAAPGERGQPEHRIEPPALDAEAKTAADVAFTAVRRNGDCLSSMLKASAFPSNPATFRVRYHADKGNLHLLDGPVNVTLPRISGYHSRALQNTRVRLKITHA